MKTGQRRPGPSHSGFTLVEMLITLALVGVLAMTSIPLFEVASTRAKEAELRQALRTIRAGLDAYKAAVDVGTLTKVAGESGYPPSLDVLTEALDVATKPGGGSDTPLAAQRIVILRQLPRDPFFPDLQAPAARTWATRSYGSRPEDPPGGADVFDVSSTTTRTGLDGTPYNTW
ncbi:MAG: type II secretion system GspH family protein [Pseudomonadota bacterium]|nr:type II secretion system GspH family protein [Pseudomonadota bacterium]